MRTQPAAVGSWAGRLLFVFIERVEEILEENMERQCFRMILGSIGISA
jgi:hypothetical protein